MKLTVYNILPTVKYNYAPKQCKDASYGLKNNQYNNFQKFNTNSCPIFKGYYGDIQPAKKLFYMISGRNTIYEDNWTKTHLVQAGIKKWVNAHPAELLKRSIEQAIQSICTLVKPDNNHPHIPAFIPTPNFGDKWGRNANYIEINPRSIAKYENGKITDGLLQAIKLGIMVMLC